MSKIFRLYSEGNLTYRDWNSSRAFPYNATNRGSIADPNGASARHEITSIPSPFARIDLVKTAFKEVCKSGDLDGNTIFHKMVSDALDVGEIFFNFDRFSNKIEILTWNPRTMIPALEGSDKDGHKYFGDALRKYMASDGPTYNFDDLNNIYLLNYISGPNPLNIIGATSPATLFFSSANDLSYVRDIRFGLDIPFDGIFQPLYERDFEFVKYFFALKNANSDFVRYFPEIASYLEMTYTAVPDGKRTELIGITIDNINLSPISVHNGDQLNQVEVLGITLQQQGSQNTGSTSKFAMNSTMVPIANIPLVLPVVSGGMYSNLLYTTANWGNENKAPYFDNVTDINSRSLPFDGRQYPYLTISDFLEDTIVKVPHRLNVENYFNGNIEGDTPGYSYLLPIKPLFFEYFTTEELQSVFPDGNPMVEMRSLAGGVKVTLRIPVRGSDTISYIEYTRTYYEGMSADVLNNKGGVTKFDFTGFVMPQIKFMDAGRAIYNISSIQLASDNIKFDFYSTGETQPIQCQHSCRDRDGQLRIDNYFIEGNNFNCIRVSQNQTAGILLPIFREQRNIEHFEFAIDLGTSNTHIEYRKRRSADPEAFSFDSRDRQLCEMFISENGGYDLRLQTELIEKDFIPAEIGRGDFRFPTRTVLSSAKTIDWMNNIEPFTLVNLPFTYDKRGDLDYNDYLCNIKWESRNREMEAFVKCLMLIIRNKVLLNDGDLEGTRITWFYPISMAPNRLRRLYAAWNDAFRKYFGDGTTTCMTESAAPINYFFRTRATAKKLVNIDIGGGTTDIAFATDNRIDYVTSFHFASNALFEDSLSDSNENGIVDWHKGRFLDLFKRTNVHELEVAYNSENNRRPANMASFLFGLKDNSVLRGAGINVREFDFNNILMEDENFKIVFLIFYTSIIYHVAQIVKTLNLEVPRHISFSGNGSKVVNIIADERILVNYTKYIFEEVLGRPYGNTLEFLGVGNEANSKESTCKGGIIGVPDGNNEVHPIVLKSDCSGTVTPSETYATLTDEYKRNTVNAVCDFFDFVFSDLNRGFNFNSNFGVTSQSMDIARRTVDEMRGSDFMTFLGRGIDQQRAEISDVNNQIGESFFFYPIKGALQAISNRIYDSLKEE